MKICFPTEDSKGLNSSIYGHFGSAPGFIFVDTNTMHTEEIRNGDLHHVHGMCQPLKALGARELDAVAVAGIGMGALSRLHAQGIKIYRAVQGTVSDNLDLIREGKLPQFDPTFTCSGHSGGGCAHS